MTISKKYPNRNERGGTRDEPTNDIKRQILDSDDDGADDGADGGFMASQPESEGHDPANDEAGAVKQSHENREHPEQDQVPGHLGYSTENLINVKRTSKDI